MDPSGTYLSAQRMLFRLSWEAVVGVLSDVLQLLFER